MVDQNTFTETIRAVQDIIRTSAEPMTREEILSYFKDMDLNRQQEDMVFEFLTVPHEEEPVEEPAEDNGEENGDSDTNGETAGYGETTFGEDSEQETNQEEDIVSKSPMFQMYLDELKDIPEYSEEQMVEMYKKLLAGEESMVHTISNAWLSNVLKVAKKLALSPEGFEDVVQEGNMALFLRLSELCGSHKKADVEEELLSAIEEAMKNCIREQTGADEQENAVVGKVALVNEAVKYLKDQNGREPSAKEIADYVKIPEEELSDILNMIEKAKKDINK
ncbi:MAG: sigma-70 domain-containing protein [Lachnospiraceae bacterium]|nr:sigma-70 domain-containing protein [Lachnospiraceae bacterium]MDY4892156.1 sigma-70 domain-containing protein [Agathobacter sp.]